MNSKKYFLWLCEFLSIVAITVIVATPSINYIWLAAPIVLMLFLKLLESRADARELYKRVYWQLKLIYEYSNFDRDAQVRCTFHVPVVFRKLLQTENYIGTDAGNGRTFPRNKGIIGKAYSQKDTRVVNFANDEEFRDRMVREFGYSKKEIGHRAADRRSYLCISLLDDSNNRVLGLVYFDSSKTGYFSDIEDPRVKDVRKWVQMVRASLMKKV